VRTNSASDDVAFNCVQQLADDEGNVGIRLTKDIVQVGTRQRGGVLLWCCSLSCVLHSCRLTDPGVASLLVPTPHFRSARAR
jgi:hypothetical protein